MTDAEDTKTSTTPAEAASDVGEEARAQVALIIEKVQSDKSAFDDAVESAIGSLSEHLARVESASQEVLTIRDDIVNARNAADTERITVQELGAKAKASLAEIENCRTEIATSKGAIDTTVSAAAADLAVVKQAKSDAEGLIGTATALSDKLSQTHEQIAAQIAALQSQQATLQGLIAQITEAKATALKDAELATAHAAETQAARTRFVQLSSETQSQFDALVQSQTALQTKIAEIDTMNAEIKVLRRALLETVKGGPKSIQQQIADLHTEITATLKEVAENRDNAADELARLQETTAQSTNTLLTASQKRFSDLYDNLQTKILSLLPSAGAAGLSTTYYDAKSRYAPTSYAGKLGAPPLSGWKGFLRRAFGYNPASVVATLFFYLLFITPLGFIAYQSVVLLYKMENNHFVLDAKMLAVRFLIVLPLATLSGFGLLSLRLYRRLYEEYNHKQRVMELYQSFGREIAENGDEEHKKALLTIMLNSVAAKAWENASRHEPEVMKSDILSNIERATDDIAKVKAIVG